MKTLWKTMLGYAITALPWETIIAAVMNAGLGLLMKKLGDPAQAETAKAKILTMMNKVANQLIVLGAALEDGKITVEEAKQLLDAWTNQQPTPPALVAKVWPV